MKVKYHMTRGYSIELQTVPEKYYVVGTTTGFGMRILMPRHTGLGWQSVDGVELTLEPEDITYFNGNIRDCVHITRGQGSKGKPRCKVEYRFDGYTMAVGVSPDEVRRIQALREEWARFRELMKRAKPRGIRVGQLHKEARRKEARRDFLALHAFFRWCNNGERYER